jgi:hypothetical protein
MVPNNPPSNGQSEVIHDCSPRASERRIAGKYDDNYLQTLIGRTPSPPVKHDGANKREEEEKQEEEEQKEEEEEEQKEKEKEEEGKTVVAEKEVANGTAKRKVAATGNGQFGAEDEDAQGENVDVSPQDKTVSMDDDWWSSDNVSAAEEAAVTHAALEARAAPMDTSAFAIGKPKKIGRTSV